MPHGEGPFPALVYLHGSMFCLASSWDFRKLARRYCEQGFCVFVLDYALAPERPFPWAVEDCVYGLRWAAANAARFGGDPERLFVAGDSAGANLSAASMAFLTGNKSRELDEGDLAGAEAALSGAVLVYGIFDFPLLMQEPFSNVGSIEVMGNQAYLGAHYLEVHRDPLVSPALGDCRASRPRTSHAARRTRSSASRSRWRIRSGSRTSPSRSRWCRERITRSPSSTTCFRPRPRRCSGSSRGSGGRRRSSRRREDRLFSEAHVPTGGTVHERWREVAAEAVLADELGFDFFGVGEQHFGGMIIDGHELATSSTPEVMHSFIAARTSRIRLRPMSVNLIPFNHPVRIAEQLAAIDVLSDGRAELGGARSNNPWTLEAFGIKAENTRSYRNETLKVIVSALSQESFEFHGEYYDIPARRLVPRPVQKPHPPIAISATGVESHTEAGRMGIAVMMGNTSAGWKSPRSAPMPTGRRSPTRSRSGRG